jgi:hypothetical protein
MTVSVSALVSSRSVATVSDVNGVCSSNRYCGTSNNGTTTASASHVEASTATATNY